MTGHHLAARAAAATVNTGRNTLLPVSKLCNSKLVQVTTPGCYNEQKGPLPTYVTKTVINE